MSCAKSRWRCPVAECRTMIAACRAAGRKLMIGYRSRFEPHKPAGDRHGAEGFRRPTRIITADHGFNAQPNQWRLDRKLSGGGSLMDIGIYSLNATRYLTGEEPVEVSAIESTDRSDPRFRTVEVRISFLLRFPSGIEATCVSSYSSNHITCTGSAVPMAGSSWSPPPLTKGRRVGPPQWPDRGAAGARRQGPACRAARPFRRVHPPTAPIRWYRRRGLADMRVIEAIYLSARRGGDHPGLTVATEPCDGFGPKSVAWHGDLL